MASGDYVELGSIDDCRVYDERGTLLERLALTGQAPLLKAGENRIAFSCDPPAGFSARAELTLAASGPPLAERSPATQINWQLLRDEYDMPRVVTKLDGKENSWEVICRKGEKPVPFGVEIDVQQAKPAGATPARPGTLTVRNPQLAIGTQRLVFPAELSPGDRLVFDGSKCRVHRKTGSEPEWIQPQGVPATLQPGRNRVVLSFGSDLPPEFRIAVSLVKHYPLKK